MTGIRTTAVRCEGESEATRGDDGASMSGETSHQASAAVPIDPGEFHLLIVRRSQPVLRLANYLAQHPSQEECMTRPFVGELLSKAAQLVELLDAYGARNNRRWRRYRFLVATAKRFADARYELLHVEHVYPSYDLLPIEKDFGQATTRALAFTGDVLWTVGTRILDEARWLALPIPDDRPGSQQFAEHLPPGRLPPDGATHEIQTARETVTRLSTAFLNLASKCRLVHVAGRAGPEAYAFCVPDPVSEESLRYLQHEFHNLQSLYDTFVSQTRSESLDPDLPSLRGHISVVYHLLKVGTGLVHYYERHMSGTADPLVDHELLLETVMNYSIGFASDYIACAQSLCQQMLQRYAEVGRIEVSVPRYRGFHVRPSTLLAKIVLHYGSDVRMELEGDSYDASTPLEVFRANEKINAWKRRRLAEEMANLPTVLDYQGQREIQPVAREIVAALAGAGHIVVYQHPLEMPDEPVRRKGTLLEWLVDEVARLQATGRIDIQAELNTAFVGDKRVLADIELLAGCGYGEDNFGNNIALPKELAYLRR